MKRFCFSRAVVVEVERSEQRQVSVPVLAIGIFLTLFGIGIYLIFPQALLSFNISLILYLLFILLLLILFGCVILALTLEAPFSRLLALVFFFWERAAIRSLLAKNLVAHRLRNRKTTMMYSLSLAFIIYLSVSFLQQRNQTEKITLGHKTTASKTKDSPHLEKTICLTTVGHALGEMVPLQTTGEQKPHKEGKVCFIG